MRRVLVVGSILFLGAAAAALADPPWTRPGDRHDGRPGGRYDNRYPSRSDARVRALARELAGVAAAVHREAERQRHHFGPREELALRALRRFDDEARLFHRQIDRRSRGRHRPEGQFRDVAASFLEAAYRLDDLHGTMRVERGFEHAARLVLELDRRYRVLDDLHHGHHRGGRGPAHLSSGAHGSHDGPWHRLLGSRGDRDQGGYGDDHRYRDDDEDHPEDHDEDDWRRRGGDRR